MLDSVTQSLINWRRGIRKHMGGGFLPKRIHIMYVICNHKMLGDKFCSRKSKCNKPLDHTSVENEVDSVRGFTSHKTNIISLHMFASNTLKRLRNTRVWCKVIHLLHQQNRNYFINVKLTSEISLLKEHIYRETYTLILQEQHCRVTTENAIISRDIHFNFCKWSLHW